MVLIKGINSTNLFPLNFLAIAIVALKYINFIFSNDLHGKLKAVSMDMLLQYITSFKIEKLLAT